MKKLGLMVGFVGALWAVTAQATLVTEVSTSPGEVVTITGTAGGYNGGGLAGIYNLVVDGVATPSFCIDVFRTGSANNTPYSYANLQDSPLSPAGPMGGAAATDIRKLWAAYFSGITTASDPNLEAAALQSAIWLDIRINSGVGALTVNGNNGSDLVYARANAMLGSLSSLTAEANLQGLVNDNGYQNYVVPVPEPTTMVAGALLLLPFGASTLRFMRKNRAA